MVARQARHALLAVIGLGLLLGATDVKAAENVESTALRLHVVPVGTVAAADHVTAVSDLLAAVPSARRRSVRFPHLPAVSVTGYNLAVMHRLHADVAAKITVGMENHRPVAAPISAAVGLGLEYQF